MRRIWQVAEFDILQLFRDRWFAGMAAAFALLALAVALVAGGGQAIVRVAPFERTAIALALLTGLFIPLVVLTLTAVRLAGLREEGVLAYLLAQPVSRGEFFAGHALGQALSMAGATLLGFGGAGVVLALRGGGGPLSSYLTLTLMAVLLALACLGAGLLISAVGASRSRTLAVALLVWLFFVLAADMAILGAASIWRPAAGVLLAMLVLSPATAFRVGVLIMVTGSGDLLGPAGMLAVSRFGAEGAAVLSAAVLALWAVIAGAAGYLAFVRRAEP